MSNTLKKLAAEGTVKKADLYRARPADLLVEPGFNVRMEGKELESHIENICKSIMAGMTVPPLEVRVTDDGKMLIVDGHCRHRAFLRAIERGCEIDFINVIPFRGNDADRICKMLVSSQGMPLSQLEAGLGYKRLEAFGWSYERIAEAAGRSASWVGACLLLAHANSDVQKLLTDGTIKASNAIKLLRQIGEQTGPYLLDKIAKGEPVNKSGLVGRPLPPKVVTHVTASVESFAARIATRVNGQLASIKAMPVEVRSAHMVEVDAETLLGLLEAAEAIKVARAPKVKAEPKPKGKPGRKKTATPEPAAETAE